MTLQVNMIYIIYIQKEKQNMDILFQYWWKLRNTRDWENYDIIFISSQKRTTVWLQKSHMLWCMEKSSMNIPLNFFFCDPGKNVIQVLNDIVNHDWSLSLLGELSLQKGTLTVQSDANAWVLSSLGRWNRSNAVINNNISLKVSTCGFAHDQISHQSIRPCIMQISEMTLTGIHIELVRRKKNQPEHAPHWHWSLWMLMF